MHVYAINNTKREKVVFCIAVLDVLVSAILEDNSFIKNASQFIWTTYFHSETGNFVYYIFSICLEQLFPFSFYAIVYFLYDKFMWKWPVFRAWHCVPDLNGHWTGMVTSPLKNEVVSIEADIIQNWNKLQVHTYSHSSASSESAAIQIEENKIYFRYSFETKREGEESYIGYNKLRYTDLKLEGEYFTNKKLADDADKGKGSKGYIVLRKESGNKE